MAHQKPWWDQCYDDPKANTFGDPSSEVVRLAEAVRRPVTVIDLGCGEGRNLAPFGKKGNTLLGCDISLKALLKAKARLQAIEASSIVWCQDVTSLPNFLAADIVICHGVVHFFVPYVRDALVRQIKAMTKAGGFAVIAAFNDQLPAPTDMKKFLQGLYSPNELERAFSDWEIVESREYTFRDEHPGGIKHHHSISKIVARRSIAC